MERRKKTWGRKLLLVLIVIAVVITLALQGSKEVKADPVVDVTGLEAGGVKSHDCDDYAVTKSNATKHWYVCAVCGKEINSKKHPSAKHTMGKKTWANGKESCDKSNSYTQTCTVCGYKETGHKPCQWDGTSWNNQSGMYTHIRECSVCHGDICYSYYYNGELYNSEGTQSCKDKKGKIINCMNPGTCAVCGETTTLGLHDLYVDKDSHVIRCNNGCGETFGTATWTLTCDNKAPNTYTWTIHYKLTGGAVFARPNGVRNINKQVYENEVTETVKSNSTHTDVTVIKQFRFLNSRKTPYATFAWDKVNVRNKNGVMVSCNIKTNMESLVPDSQAPKITSAAIENADIWKQRKQITVTGTENWCNTVTIQLKKKSTGKIIYTGTATVSGGNYSLAFIPDLEEGENGSAYTIVVTDSCGNEAQKNLTIKKTDSIAPAVADNLATENKWSKTKDYTFKATDSGSGSVKISFNSTNGADYLSMNANGTTFSQKYTFTGDVYSTDGVLAAVYFTDSLKNTTTKFIRIYKLDNTAPTITQCTYEEGVNEGTFTVTAHDVNSKLGKSGSGVAGYAVTTTKTVPDISKFQKAKTVKITSDGTYYLWAIDAAGNISAPVEKKATVKHLLTVNPNGGTWEDSTEIREFYYNYGRVRNISDAEPEPQVGMKFIRWDFSTTARSVSTFNAATKRFTMGSSDATLKAKFEYIQYNLAYDFSGGAKAAGGSYPAKAAYNTSFSVTPPVRSGYTFGGWTISGMNTHDDENKTKNARHYYSTTDSYSDANSAYGVESCNVEARFIWFKNLRSTLNGDAEATVTFTAKWQKNEYSLTVNPNLGSWSGSTESQTITLPYEEKTEISDPVRAGYTFTGWTLSGEGSSLNENTFTMGWENAVLFANWEVNHYVIHFDGNGATEGEMDDIPMIYDVPQKLPENKFVRENDDGESRFLGWSMDSGAKEAAYEDEEEIKNLTEHPEETIILYAIWDDCPWIEATDLYYPLEQAQSGYITLEELMSHATAGDKEDGDIAAGEDAEKHTTFDIWDYLPTDFTFFDSNGSVTETYRAIDSAGNVTKKMITVHIVDTTPTDPEPIRTTRFINEKYYYAPYEEGGLEPDSIWLTDPEYRATIEQAFENLRNNTPLYEFHFSHETILQMKQFVQDNGFGNGKYPDALDRFWEEFMKPNRVGGSAPWD